MPPFSEWSPNEKISAGISGMLAFLLSSVFFIWTAMSYYPYQLRTEDQPFLSIHDTVVDTRPRTVNRAGNKYRLSLTIMDNGESQRISVPFFKGDGYFDEFPIGRKLLIYITRHNTPNDEIRVWQVMDERKNMIIPYDYIHENLRVDFFIRLILASLFFTFGIVFMAICLYQGFKERRHSVKASE
ncbi:hypothetical protein [Halotalea alkalilenta]|uniref:hypothetical protein n=1 Tax=Halotalea alkalilenta TaxID=376489 RepID=UPI0012DC32F3|nr:hypothetical protein [Halotalea alkalilenta]